MTQAQLALEDGTVVTGEGLGVPGISAGELVFTTTFTGYEESLTDPSYRGQNLMFTYPLIGNYGFSGLSAQSDSVQAEGVVVKEACGSPSHRHSKSSIHDYLLDNGSRGISGVDTRCLTVKIREKGAVKSAIAVGDYERKEVLAAARNQPSITETDLISEVSVEEPVEIGGSGPRMAVVDTGAKKNILKDLLQRNFHLTVYPHDTPAEEIAEKNPDALFLVNGPGDPKRAKNPIEVVRKFFGEIPIFGICFGAQIIALALGGDTYKLKFGHRGANQPVLDESSGIVEITAQNHGFAIDGDSLTGAPLVVTEKNATDGTVEAVESKSGDVFAVQYHPEGAPGPKDREDWFFDKVLKITEGQYAKA
ncbi:MAG: glutamine-hydrolyzing carbamoyl-phosphate synthase small subunit [Candidatus Bipolaricaulota bacterium]